MLHFQNGNLTVFKSTLFQTTTVIIETEQAIIMTDPNWLPEEVKEIRSYIDERLGDRKLYIIYTHSDYDHLIGAGAFPDAFVIASRAFHHNKRKDQIVDEMKAFDRSYYIERDYEHCYPTVDRLITTDNDMLKLGEATLKFYLAPGHTEDGLFTIVEPYCFFLSGDYLSDVEFPFIYSSYKDYKRTMKKAQSITETYNISYHVPGHGNVTDSKEEVMDRLNFSDHYLTHLTTDFEKLEDECKARYPFFEGMKESHQKNFDLTASELKNKKR
jgi:glyoxylase-like metal-dependent hydrolase (beta-lactamase superfamily II)